MPLLVNLRHLAKHDLLLNGELPVSELDLDTLLTLILTEARRLTRSEAGSLYVKEGGELVFKLAQNDRLPESGALRWSA